jgi:two-component system sensor histidine kinase AlgZ
VQAALAFVGVGGTLLWLVAVCGLRGALRDRSAGARSAVVLALGATAAVTGWLPLWWAGLGGDAHALRIAGLALAGAAFAGLLWAWLDLRARIWHPADASARLAELQSRIRPHFLFNALNTALALVRTDPAKAEAVLEDLAQLFRTALAETGASVPLDEEIELAKRYLDIEHARYGDRLRVHWEVDPRCGAARVPPLVLQPLVENAVRHGVEPAAAGGDVWVRVLRQRAQVLVTVSNTLGDEPGTPGHGMALHNVRERLRLLHDVGAQCDVWRDVSRDVARDVFSDGSSGVSRDQTPPTAMFHARITLPAP